MGFILLTRVLGTLGILTLALSALATSGCAALGSLGVVQFGVEGWEADLEGDAQIGTDFDVGTEFELSELGLEQEEEAIVYRGVMTAGGLAIHGKYFQLDYEGDATLTRDIDFGGQTFTVSTDVESMVEIEFASLHGRFGLLNLGIVRLGAIVGFNYLAIDARLQAPALSLTESDSVEVPFPVVGLTINSVIPISADTQFFIDGEISGLIGDYQEIDGRFIDASVRGGLALGFLTMGAGYRLLEADFEEDESEANLELSGPFVFAELVF